MKTMEHKNCQRDAFFASPPVCIVQTTYSYIYLLERTRRERERETARTHMIVSLCSYPLHTKQNCKINGLYHPKRCVGCSVVLLLCRGGGTRDATVWIILRETIGGGEESCNGNTFSGFWCCLSPLFLPLFLTHTHRTFFHSLQVSYGDLVMALDVNQ